MGEDLYKGGFKIGFVGKGHGYTPLWGIEHLHVFSENKYSVSLISGGLRQYFFLDENLYQIICRFRGKSRKCLHIADSYNRLAEQLVESSSACFDLFPMRSIRSFSISFFSTMIFCRVSEERVAVSTNAGQEKTNPLIEIIFRRTRVRLS